MSFAGALLAIAACAYAAGSEASANRVNGLIVFTRQDQEGRNRIFLMNADGSGQRPLTRLADDALYPALSPHADRIAFIAGRDDSLAVMNADGSNRRILRRSSVWGDAGKPSWSPNGKGIAYENRSTDSIDYVNADDTGHRVLRVKAFSPAWSPNGKAIAFTNASGDLWVMNANGKGARPLLRADRLSLFDAPAWSPDGTKIAFVRLHGILDGTIFIINADGSDPHFLLPPSLFAYEFDQEDPVWSPDGTKLAFTGHRPYAFAQPLYVINADGSINSDGSGQAQLTRGTRDFDPSWR